MYDKSSAGVTWTRSWPNSCRTLTMMTAVAVQLLDFKVSF